MSDDICMNIPIPTDDDGYVLLKCSFCGTLFKSTPTDVEDDGVLELYCPSCGLSSDSYLTDDVIELVITLFENRTTDIVYDELKKMERQLSKGLISFKTGNKPKPETKNPIRSGVEALKITNFPCCKRTVKIKLMLRMTGCYCPFCGVKNYEIE